MLVTCKHNSRTPNVKCHSPPSALSSIIILKDVNDNSPYFNEADIYITLSNELPVRSSVTRLFAFDKDTDDSITYTIINDPAGNFQTHYKIELYYSYVTNLFRIVLYHRDDVSRQLTMANDKKNLARVGVTKYIHTLKI